jgi:hypothetical protein
MTGSHTSSKSYSVSALSNSISVLVFFFFSQTESAGIPYKLQDSVVLVP